MGGRKGAGSVPREPGWGSRATLPHLRSSAVSLLTTLTSLYYNVHFRVGDGSPPSSRGWWCVSPSLMFSKTASHRLRLHRAPFDFQQPCDVGKTVTIPVYRWLAQPGEVRWNPTRTRVGGSATCPSTCETECRHPARGELKAPGKSCFCTKKRFLC